MIEECQEYRVLGINGFKIRLGHEYDYQRVKAMREAMGDNFFIMLDANQRYNVSQTLQIIRKMSEFNITWIEEPCMS